MIEDYKQKYEEALERAKYIKENTDSIGALDVSVCFEKIFPELKESKDERMWTLIKKYAHSNISDMVLNADHITRKELEDWLEKQGEQEQLYIRFGEIPTDEKSKIYQEEIEIGTENGVSVYPAFKTDEGDIVLGLSLPITKTTLYTQQHLLEYDNRPCYLVKGDYVGKDADGQPLINNISIIEKIDGYRIKEEKQDNPTEKVEPKFKVGDWIVNKKGAIGKINEIKNDSCGILRYYIEWVDGNRTYPIPCFVDDYCYLWTIEDAKKGDILQANKCILIFDSLAKDIDGNTVISSWYYCNTKTFYGMGTCKPDLWVIEGVTPATQEQRHLLFQKMKEAGYEWDVKEKKLTKL